MAKIAWPEDKELLALIERNGSRAGAARWLNVPVTSLKDHLTRQGLRERVGNILTKAEGAPANVRVDGSTVHVTLPADSNPQLGDYEQMLRERGLEPDEWVVVSVKSNEWDAMTAVERGAEPNLVRMRQWSITLRPAASRLLALPAQHVPPVKRTRVGPPASDRPETIVVEGDHHFPTHDPVLHEASLTMLRELSRKHRLAEQVFLGDTLDLPTISRHDDHPAAMTSVNDCIQAAYVGLREKREAAPNIRVRKLKGNHDWRLESELLKRAERMYGIRPAQQWDEPDEPLPALHINRLLHLENLGVELVEDPRGWEHAEVELVAGPSGLVVRHGWLHGATTAAASVTKRGRSIIVGHIHRREHAFVWDPSMEVERVGVVAGTMSLVRNERFPHYATLDNWLQGCVIVTRWPDGDFQVEHVRWNGETLRWRHESWR